MWIKLSYFGINKAVVRYSLVEGLFTGGGDFFRRLEVVCMECQGVSGSGLCIEEVRG